jgi:hypothetical protein
LQSHRQFAADFFADIFRYVHAGLDSCLLQAIVPQSHGDGKGVPDVGGS